MQAYVTAIGGFLLFIVFPAALILWIRDRGQYRESDAERQQRHAAWRERMIHPEVEKVEIFCGGKLPQQLIDMYSNHSLVLSHYLEACALGKDPEWWVGSFEPMTVQDQEQAKCDQGDFGKGVIFAWDDMGNFYWVPVDDERKKDAPVYFAGHDTAGNEKVTESLKEFLSWLHVRS